MCAFAWQKNCWIHYHCSLFCTKYAFNTLNLLCKSLQMAKYNLEFSAKGEGGYCVGEGRIINVLKVSAERSSTYIFSTFLSYFR